ncbi:MAG: alpha-N-acetylglucosaminidase [Bacteroidales bacterium]|nr:alpha-N-acetylglucosaminidase [Bacteroidales bacterium]
MKRSLIILIALLGITSCFAANPIVGLLERIDKGASSKFAIQLQKSDIDFFELDQKGDKVVVRGNTYVNIATGINWYLKYYAGINLTWNSMSAKLPNKLPVVAKKERHETNLALRYDFNYCTFSYSMAFWDWARWEKEIDWMALHGVNMPLAAVGHECVWRNMLLRLGYSKEDINSFIAGPAFLAWWEMNNLEGWGGPNPDSWYAQQEALQKSILKRMYEYGMSPVLPGYSGMVPSKLDIGSRVASANADDNNSSTAESAQSSIAKWNGFDRPAVLMPDDPMFNKIADLFYEETTRLYGKAKYYSMDPFHEAKNLPADLDFGKAGKVLMEAMKRVNKDAVWVIQGWTENPRPEMLAALKPGDLLILDLFSECRPMWGIPSLWKRDEGYGDHEWLFCMLENFGANVGLHGRMDQLLNNFYLTKTDSHAAHIKGIGFTMEGSETNPVMYELMSELIWRPEKITKEEWISTYVKARYGADNDAIQKAWAILVEGIYNCPQGNNQQGPHESIFCSRPSLTSFQASSWSKMCNYYDPNSTMEAARLMLSVADNFKGNNNFEYDLIDICRQAIADRARIIYSHTVADFNCFNKKDFTTGYKEFLRLLLLQDELLSARSEFRVGRWIEMAKSLGNTQEEKNLYEWNARVQITTWGNRYCADTGKLRDYAHKEWNGLLKDYYYPRWVKYWSVLQDEMDGKLPVMPTGNSSTKPDDNPAMNIDWYAMEEPWTLSHNIYAADSAGDPIEIAKRIFSQLQ